MVFGIAVEAILYRLQCLDKNMRLVVDINDRRAAFFAKCERLMVVKYHIKFVNGSSCAANFAVDNVVGGHLSISLVHDVMA
jgi:hypothetical protein